MQGWVIDEARKIECLLSICTATLNSLIKEHARLAVLEFFRTYIYSNYHVANEKRFHNTLTFYAINEKKIFPHNISFILK